MKTRVVQGWGWLIAAVAPLVVTSARAGPPQNLCVPCQTERYLSGLPANYEAVVCVNNGARQRQSSQGRALAAAIEDAGIFPETMRAWRDLGAVLELPGERAFDELLGRRATLVARGLDSGAEAQWALVTEVSSEMEKRLCEHLKASPRGNCAGLTVLAVEDGKYGLVIGRGVPAGLESGPPTAAVLLAPSDSPLMAELAPSLLTRTGLASPAPVWRAGQKERDCDLVVLMRRGGTGAGSRTLSLAATLEETGWDSRVTCSADQAVTAWAGGAAKAGPDALRPWSSSAFKQMESEALVAAMGTIGSMRALPSWAPVSALEQMLSGVDAGACGQLAALVVRPARSERHDPPAARTGGEQAMLVLSDRHLVHPSEPTPRAPDEPVRLAVTLAVEAEQGCDPVSRGDQAVARFVGMLQGGDQDGPGGAGGAVQLEVGVPDSAVRTLTFDQVPIDGRFAAATGRLFGEEPCLTWGTTRPATIAAAARPGGGGGDHRGWWIASLSPRGLGWMEHDAGTLMSPAAGDSARHLSMGLVRPAAIGAAMGDAAAQWRWVRWVDSLRWEAHLTDDGTVEGTVSVRMAMPPR